MATNPPYGDGHRNGAVRKRTQLDNKITGTKTKRNKEDGRFMDVKKDNKKFKGVTEE